MSDPQIANPLQRSAAPAGLSLPRLSRAVAPARAASVLTSVLASAALVGCSESETLCAAPGPQCDSTEDESATPCDDLEVGCRQVSVTQCGETYVSYCRAPECPESNPIGGDCARQGQVCAYGYLGDDCGGITALCVDGTWTEREHTDPGPDCPGNSVDR